MSFFNKIAQTMNPQGQQPGGITQALGAAGLMGQPKGGVADMFAAIGGNKDGGMFGLGDIAKAINTPGPDYANNFNTPLDPAQEPSYQDWIGKLQGKGIQNIYDTSVYDLPGLYKATNGNVNVSGMLDKYAKPNHPTFSDQSIYHGQQSPWGQYTGGTWVDDGTSFIPSKDQLQNIMKFDDMQSNFKKYRPNDTLIRPY